MSGKAAFIGGDWGTSRLRLFLCDDTGTVLARTEGLGVSQTNDCAQVFAKLTAEWDASLPAVLCGMVGSTIGWREIPYLDCPATPDGFARSALCFDVTGRTIALLPGLSCVNKTGMPDVMRGEETQLAGALRDPALMRGRHLICLPGTHAKWVLVENGAVMQFQTALSGELFDLLARHSVLARDGGEARAEDPAFGLGLRAAQAHRGAGLLHLLFSTRSRQLSGEIAKSQAASYLSGLIIGEDVAAAAALFGFAGPVTLICTPTLAALYAKALDDYGTRILDGEAAARAGLFSAYQSLFA